MKRVWIITAIVLTAAITAPLLVAKNVDLVTLPVRDSVQLTIYNSEDITLVKETRNVTLKEGSNKLQFSWANTLIDPTSVEIRPLTHAAEIEVVDTIFPGQKPQHLIWNIESEFEGQVAMEVTYFTSGLTWTMDYVAVTDPDETVMQFDGYVRVFNSSGEEYENAEIRLIVGTINLVERIADLARRRGIAVPERESAQYQRLRREETGRAMAGAEMAVDEPADAPATRARQIVTEGVSEYFMFSVEGTETIPNGWSKRMQALDADDVSFDVVYRMRAHQYGPRPVKFFIWTNDEEHELGDSPLPNGRVNIFRLNDQDGLSFLGQQAINYVPITDDIEVNLGPDDLVVYETQRMSVERLNFHFHRDSRGREYVDGWDDRIKWVDTVRNYHDEPITFELRRVWQGDVEYDSEVATTLFDYRTTETTFDVDARDKLEYPATVTTHYGENAKQNRVRLLTPQPEREG
jgi:hypothetical protein